MRWIDPIVFTLRSLFGLRRKEIELDDELRFHLDMEVERRIAAGQEPAEASRAARLEFGSPEAIKDACRDTWGTRLIDETRRDLKTGVRHWLQAPGFAAAVIGSLAIGLGASTVIFGIVDTVLLRPLPFDQPERIVGLFELTPQGDRFSASDQNFLDFRESSRSLETIAAVAFPSPRPSLGIGGERIRLEAEAVSPSFFAVFGVEARLGRTFDPSEDGPGKAPRGVVLSDAAWRRHFAADPGVVGRSIDLDGESWTVLGVLPEDFRFATRPDLFLPYEIDSSIPRGDHRLSVYGRLAPGFSFEQADDEVAAIAARLAATYPDSNGLWGAELQSIEEQWLGGTTRQTNLILLGVVVLLLLITCANVSHLFLVRANDRRDEIGLRLALGAGRVRLVRQLVTEALVLGVLGAAGGLMLAIWGVSTVRGLGVPLPRLDALELDWRVFAFLTTVAVLASLIGSLLPSLRATRVEGGDALRSRRHGSDVGDRRLRSSLVIAEVALATVLTIGTGLLLHSFEALQQVDSGFATSGVLLARVDLPPERYPMEQRRTGQFFERLVERLESVPGVDSVASTMSSPYEGPGTQNEVAVESETDADLFMPVRWRAVSPELFRTLGIPLHRGRSFDPMAQRVEAVLSASVAARLWPGEDPIGQRVRWIHPSGPLFEVVGIVGEVQDLHIGEEPPPTVYVPQRVFNWSPMTIAVRSSLPLDTLIGPVKAAVAELDPLLAAPQMSTLAGQRSEALAGPLLGVRLLGVASMIAVLLAAIGIYGVVAYAVSQRRREMGVRVAMGARPDQLVRLMLKDGVLLVGLGVAGGLLISLGLVESMRAILYSTSPFDPAVLGSAALVLLVIGLLASSLPALRAARVDPIKVLRQE